MPVSRIACPNCHTGFQTGSRLVAGQKIKCPRCGAYFAIPARGGKSRQAIPGRTPPTSGTQKAQSRSKKWVIVLLLGILLVIGVVAVIWHQSTRDGVKQEGDGPSVVSSATKQGERKERANVPESTARHVLETSEMPVTDLPELVAGAVKKKYPMAVVVKVDQIRNKKNVLTAYTLNIVYDNIHKEILVTPDGKVFGER